MMQKQSHISKQELKGIMEKVFKATAKDCENIRDNKYQKNKNWIKCLALEQKFQCYIYDRLCNALNNKYFLVIVECRLKKKKNYSECDLVIFNKDFSKEKKPDFKEVEKYLKRTARYPQTYAPEIVQRIFNNKLKPLVVIELKTGYVSSAKSQFVKFENDLRKLKDSKQELKCALKYAVLINDDDPDKKLSEKGKEKAKKKIKSNLETIKKYNDVKAYYLTRNALINLTRCSISELMKSEFVLPK